MELYLQVCCHFVVHLSHPAVSVRLQIAVIHIGGILLLGAKEQWFWGV